MANHNHTVDTSKHGTLDAGGTDTITITGQSFSVIRSVEVYNWSTDGDIIWFTTDGTNPTPRRDDCYFALPGMAVNVTRDSPVVKVHSTTAVDYSVTSY